MDDERGAAALARLNARLAPLGVAAEVRPNRGRSLVVTRAFKAGDVVLSSSAFAAAILPELAPLRCSGCFERSSHLMRCGACKCAFFCSKPCQRQAWVAGHKRCAVSLYSVLVG